MRYGVTSYGVTIYNFMIYGVTIRRGWGSGGGAVMIYGVMILGGTELWGCDPRITPHWVVGTGNAGCVSTRRKF
jgi:hypothetical protein